MSVRVATSRRGMGIIELLVSLAIAAMLLTAVAAAYAAASGAVQMNDEFFRASQAARVSINQVMAEIRKCSSNVVDVQAIEITDPVGEKRIYAFDVDNQLLTLTFPERPGAPTYTMARNVDFVEFFTDGITTCMTVTVEVGTNKVTLTGSAMPRRTLAFN